MNQLCVTFHALELANLSDPLFTTSCVGYKVHLKGHMRLKHGLNRRVAEQQQERARSTAYCLTGDTSAV